jgi:predicted Zn-dependent protease
LLRFSLGNEHLKAGDAARAAEHLARAVALDPDFTAAWKLYGKALAAAGREAKPLRPTAPACESPASGATSRRRKEMRVFARRLQSEARCGPIRRR